MNKNPDENDAREAAGRAAGGVADGLEYVMTLVDAAAPGPWLWSENGNIVPEQYADDCEIAAVYSERDDDCCPINASAIIAAVNWLRANGRSMLSAAQGAKTGGASGGWAIRVVDGDLMVSDPGCRIGAMYPSPTARPLSERLLHALASAMLDAPPPAPQHAGPAVDDSVAVRTEFRGKKDGGEWGNWLECKTPESRPHRVGAFQFEYRDLYMRKPSLAMQWGNELGKEACLRAAKEVLALAPQPKDAT